MKFAVVRIMLTALSKSLATVLSWQALVIDVFL